MTRTFFLLFALAFSLMGCASGYEVRASSRLSVPPDRALASHWVQMDPNDLSPPVGPSLRSFYANGTVEGRIIIKLAESEYGSASDEAFGYCGALTRRKAYCSDIGFINLDGNAESFHWNIDTVDGDRRGAVFTRAVAPGDGGSAADLVCLGSWSVFGTAEQQKAQHEKWVERLKTACKAEATN